MSLASVRLQEERKNWRKDHPPNFYARPTRNEDGSTNMMIWDAGIPGPEDSDWEGGLYKLKIIFSADYPMRSPTCKFTPVIYHPNVYGDGSICLSVLNQDWRPSVNLKQILLAIQDMLTNPNPNSPANSAAGKMYTSQKKEYSNKIKAQALQHQPTDDDDE